MLVNKVDIHTFILQDKIQHLIHFLNNVNMRDKATCDIFSKKTFTQRLYLWLSFIIK